MSAGDSFAGYQIEGVLGAGAMGVIYHAKELLPERKVALKVVAPELATDAASRRRFMRESQLAARIDHPNVVPVFRIGEENGVLFISMRLVEGRDLSALITSQQRLEPLRAARIIDQVADALDSAHEKGLVHRDVKPPNILVETRSRGDHAYLTDFGITKHLGSVGDATQAGAVLGSVHYMAPEQVEGDRVDARTDVYALGCVLFQALTGQVPYPRDNGQACMFAHIIAPPPTVSDLVPDVPREFDEIIARALAKQPDDRYFSTGDLGIAALAAAERRSVGRPERTVASGEAAWGPGQMRRRLEEPAVEAPARPERGESSPAVSEEPAPPKSERARRDREDQAWRETKELSESIRALDAAVAGVEQLTARALRLRDQIGPGPFTEWEAGLARASEWLSVREDLAQHTRHARPLADINALLREVRSLRDLLPGDRDITSLESLAMVARELAARHHGTPSVRPDGSWLVTARHGLFKRREWLIIADGDGRPAIDEKPASRKEQDAPS